MSPVPAEFTFEQYEVGTGTAKRQTVLTGFLLGGTIAELVVVKIDAEDNRRLHIYAFDDENWTPRLDATLRPEVLFVDIANIGGRDRLITYESGHLNWFDPESATERPLVTVISNTPPPEGEIPHVDVTHDLNGDDRDDLVVPDSDGFWVFIQMDDGTFADPVKIGPPIEIGRIYAADGYRYDPWARGRVHEMDYNRDGAATWCSGTKIISSFITKMSVGYFPRWLQPSRPRLSLTPMTSVPLSLPMGCVVGVSTTEHPEP